ncbi:hypothetical protein K7X08_033070 [Anisodus acutangulus]|uniref:BHLH domain-containing protein n=1 Tax=Anisodus acutangulus TaxID=402998 RepID=A0A9Q1RC76_9SOLA|nr:hypothetical protein K7X08_033070 [Anisodus acutangulus]
MQINYQFSPQKPFVSLEDQAAGGNIFDIPAPSVFGTMALPTGFRSSVPFHGFEFQSSEACPKNFIIFDQTDHRNQIMYHPAMASKFPYPDLNYNATCFQDGMERKISNNENIKVSSSYLKDDSDDINALLSLEEEEEYEKYDDEEVSTARTDANYGSSSPESYSNYDCQSKKSRTSSSFRKSSGSSTSNCGERKRRKLKKMVKALKRIVPGASRMNTVTVLDEAVRYLKSLKVEVQKVGVENLKSYT